MSNVEESVIIPKNDSESLVVATCYGKGHLTKPLPVLHSQMPAILPAMTALSASIDRVMQFNPTASFKWRSVIAPDDKGHMMIAGALQ